MFDGFGDVILKRENTDFIDYLRVFAVCLILCCHLASASNYGLIQMSAQFFNVGVSVFFVISGFCFGLQDRVSNVFVWYKKRLRRIFIALDSFLFLLLFVYLFRGFHLPFWNWLSCLFGVQGAVVGCLGADHTWFISSLLLCYLITPFLYGVVKFGWFVFAQMLIVPVLLSLFPNVSVFTIGCHLSFYVFAYFLGANFRRYNGSVKSSVYFILILLSFACRLGFKFLMDGSRFYDCIVVWYMHYLLAFCFLGLFYNVFKECKSGKFVKFLCSISFEIYLVHYMFIVGPVSLMGVFNSYVLNCILVVFVSVVVAYVLHSFCLKLEKLVN